MNLQQIKDAVNAGQTVCWSNNNYKVVTGTFPNKEVYWNIVCVSNNHTIGLTWTDGVTMNGKEEDFFIQPSAKDEVSKLTKTDMVQYIDKSGRGFAAKISCVDLLGAADEFNWDGTPLNEWAEMAEEGDEWENASCKYIRL